VRQRLTGGPGDNRLVAWRKEDREQGEAGRSRAKQEAEGAERAKKRATFACCHRRVGVDNKIKSSEERRKSPASTGVFWLGGRGASVETAGVRPGRGWCLSLLIGSTEEKDVDIALAVSVQIVLVFVLPDGTRVGKHRGDLGQGVSGTSGTSSRPGTSRLAAH
jgi:hypothetical protein